MEQAVREQSLLGPAPAGSVAPRRSTLYTAGSSSAFHSSSVFTTACAAMGAAVASPGRWPPLTKLAIAVQPVAPARASRLWAGKCAARNYRSTFFKREMYPGTWVHKRKVVGESAAFPPP